MSVPFSNIHLRVPRGFGNILEGLAREVLREQPNDIPTFAALYFNTLLKQREESGLGPAEWGARLEDRFYSNPAFKSVKQDNLSSAKDKESGAIPNEGKELDEPKGEIVQSPKNTTWSDNDSDTSEGSQTVESVERDEFDKVDQDIGQIQPELTLESSYKGGSDIDICAEELKGTEDKEQTSKRTEVTTDDEILNKAEQDICKAELVPTLQPPFGGLANLDVCAEGFKSTEGDRELTSECSEDSRNLINTSLTIAVESLDEVEIHDGLTLSGVKSPEHSEQDVDADLGDKNDEEEIEKSVTGVGEVPKMDYPPEHSQFTVSDMTEGIRAEEDITDPYQGSSLDKEAEYVNVLSERSTFDGKDRGHIEPRTHEDEPQSVADMPEFAPEQSDIQQSCEPLSEKSAESMAPSEEVDGSHSNPTELDNEDTSENDMDVVGQEAISIDHFSSTVVDVRQNEKMSEDHGGSNMIDEDNLNSSLNATEMDLTHDCAAEFSEVLTSEVNVSEMDMKAEDMFNDNNDRSDDSSDDEEMNQIDLSSYCQDTVTIELDEEERDQENDKFDNEEVDFPQANEQETSAGGKADTQQDMLLGGIDSALQSVEAPHEVCAEELAQVLPDNTEENSALEEQHESMDNPSSDNNETEDPESKAGTEECNQPQEEEDVMDIPLDDPEANKAAAKIQAGFRGHMTRKKMKDDKPSEEVSSSGEAHNGSQGDTGGAEGLETDDTSVPEQ